MAEVSRANRRARSALNKAEAALAAYQVSDAVDPYHLANLRTARDLARAVYAVIDDDDRHRGQRQQGLAERDA